MSHLRQIRFVQLIKEEFGNHFDHAKVLEVGSLDINGSVRQLFRDCDYLGIDVGAGPGVDLVVGGQEYSGPDNHFDTVISCECFEHNPHWTQTFNNMWRVLKPNGLFVLSCASHGRPEHGTTRTSPQASPLTVGLGWDYYQNLCPRDFRAVELQKLFLCFRFWVNYGDQDLYFAGVKRPGNDQCASSLRRAEQSVSRFVGGANRRLRHQCVALLDFLGGERAIRAAKRVINFRPARQ
jgi:SAM-dependent methyltransferase